MCSNSRNGKEKVVHHGIVRAVGNGIATVELIQADHDCSGCALTSFCSGPSSPTLHVKAHGATPAMIGQRVEIHASHGARSIALWLYMALPLILCLLSIAICTGSGMTDGEAGAIGAAALTIWYASLYLLKNRINSKVNFEIV